MVFSDPYPTIRLFRIQIRILHEMCKSDSASKALRGKLALYACIYNEICAFVKCSFVTKELTASILF
jgi:hypothetical protein